MAQLQLTTLLMKCGLINTTRRKERRFEHRVAKDNRRDACTYYTDVIITVWSGTCAAYKSTLSMVTDAVRVDFHFCQQGLAM